MPTEIVVDTNALRHKDFAKWLRRYMGAKYIPVVAYAESAKHSLNRGQTLAAHHDYLVRSLGLIVERMDDRHARLAARLAHSDGEGGWHGNARDYFIAAHVADTGRRLVTENLDDFTCLGRGAIPIEEAMRRL